MKTSNSSKKYIPAAIAFWLAVWQLVSMAVASRVLLPGPVSVIRSLAGLVITADFWKTVGNSFLHIVAGFVLASGAGILLAVLSYICMPVKVIVRPLMLTVKSVPVASFIILVLLWVSSCTVPALISFLMVLPVVYVNVLTGIEAADAKMLEMARVFKMTCANRVKYIYMPALRPHLVSALSIGLGFCWKSGIAAEVIALSPNAIGRRLYDAKLYLMTDELFAWTVVIVLISIAFEKLVMLAIRRVLKVPEEQAK